MRIRVGFVAFVAVVACKQGAGDDYGVQPGGPGGDDQSGGSNADAAIPADGSGSAVGIDGRVCLAADSRKLSECAGSGAGGFVVTLGTSTATTNDEGRFVMPVPAQTTGLVWHVTGSTIQESAMVPSGPSEIPAISTTLYDAMLGNAQGVMLNQDQGGVILRVRQGAGPAVGATATSLTAASDLFFDGSDDTVWLSNAVTGTGAFGDAWIPVEPVGSITVGVTSSGVTQDVPVQIFNQALTFVTVTFP